MAESIPLTPDDLVLYIGDQLDAEGRLLVGDVALGPLLERAGPGTREREVLDEVIDGLENLGFIEITGHMGDYRHKLTATGIQEYHRLREEREREQQKRHPLRGLQIRLDDWLRGEEKRTPHATPLLRQVIRWVLAYVAGLVTGLVVS